MLNNGSHKVKNRKRKSMGVVKGKHEPINFFFNPTHLTTQGTHSMLGVLEVKGDATEASASDSEMPMWAAFNAPQSLAPSPHIPT